MTGLGMNLVTTVESVVVIRRLRQTKSNPPPRAEEVFNYFIGYALKLGIDRLQLHYYSFRSL